MTFLPEKDIIISRKDKNVKKEVFMKRRLTALFLAAFLLLPLAGCATSPEPGTGTEESKGFLGGFFENFIQNDKERPSDEKNPEEESSDENGSRPESDLYVLHFPYADIYEEGLLERVKQANADAIAYYEELDKNK